MNAGPINAMVLTIGRVRSIGEHGLADALERDTLALLDAVCADPIGFWSAETGRLEMLRRRVAVSETMRAAAKAGRE